MAATLTISDGTTSTNLAAFLPATPQAMTYDDDGNLKTDGRFEYEYDAENRLLSAATSTAAVTAGHVSTNISFIYDYLGRRIRKVGTLGGYSFDNRFVYNGWNPVAEFWGAYNGGAFVSTYSRHHFWGLDLSGSLSGAGGVGGLLMVQEGGNSYLPAYDALGNVHAMIKASDGTLAAAYEYDAFGNTLRESGPYAASNPFRFATKYTDIETGLVQYNTRYYSPSLGRFINRDSIGEAGGLNLYAYVSNRVPNAFDRLGMDVMEMDGSGGFDPGIGKQTPRGTSMSERVTIMAQTVNPGLVDSQSLDFALRMEEYEFAARIAGIELASARAKPVVVFQAPDKSRIAVDTNTGTTRTATASEDLLVTSGETPLFYSPGEPGATGQQHAGLGPDGTRYIGPLVGEFDLTGSYVEATGLSASIGSILTDPADLIHNELYWRQKNGKWTARTAATKANYTYNRSFELAGKRLTAWKVMGTRIGVFGVFVSILDIAHNGSNVRNVLDLGFGVAGFIPPVGTAMSVTYSLVTLSWDLYEASRPMQPPPEQLGVKPEP